MYSRSIMKWGFINCAEIVHICKDKNLVDNLQERLEAPMPWIGMYIAAASACCGLAMACDLFKGFMSRNLSFPCKFFSLNAVWLTILAVAMKLTVDLTTDTKETNDHIVRVSSLALMSIAIGNFMTSVASMNNNEILANVAALFILVLTIAVNTFIHNKETQGDDDNDASFNRIKVFSEQFCIITLMFFMVILLCSWAIVVSKIKADLEYKYQKCHENVSEERTTGDTIKLSLVLKKYWVMAETGNPQFVMGRSVICVASGFVSLLTAFTLVVASIRLHLVLDDKDIRFHNGNPLSLEMSQIFKISPSMYKWSINWILYIQIVGVIIGTIAPVMRWFLAVRLNVGCKKGFKEEMKVDAYWSQQLVEWRDSSIPIHIRHNKYRKVIHVTIRFLLKVCIVIQIMTIRASKLIMLFSVTCTKIAFWLFCLECTPLESTHSDFRKYVLLLESEPEMPYKTILSISSEIDEFIQIGKNQRPKNMIQLLQKSENFNGVREFDNKNVKSLHSKEPPNCWSLPIVTLTSIAISLPGIPKLNIDDLLSGVRESLSFVEFIDKTADTNGNISNIRNAARGVWARLELHRKWHDKSSMQETNSNNKQTLQELSDIAHKIVTDFKNGATDFVMDNPSNWPVKVIDANSMFRICQTFLSPEESSQSNEEMFERLSAIISDILTACFTNLSYIISVKCHKNTIKERAKNIRQAAVLLGKSEEFMVKYQPITGLDADEACYIDKWRTYLEQNSNDQEHVSITMGGAHQFRRSKQESDVFIF